MDNGRPLIRAQLRVFFFFFWFLDWEKCWRGGWGALQRLVSCSCAATLRVVGGRGGGLVEY